MTLADFLQSLFAEGKVVANGKPDTFSRDELRAAEQLLRQYYSENVLEMPARAPAFHAEAALGGAQYLYNAVQLTINRDLDEVAVEQHLAGLPEPASPEIIYSADLTLRYLPELFTLAKGLSPLDIVATKLKDTAACWPFSSVGVDIGSEYVLEKIIGHPALKYAYADRILAKKDKSRAQHPLMKDLICEIMGAYSAELWPEWVYEGL